MTTSEVLRLVRKNKKLSLRQIERRTGLCNSYVCKIIGGYTCSIKAIKKLCEAYPDYEKQFLLSVGIQGEFIKTAKGPDPLPTGLPKGIEQ